MTLIDKAALLNTIATEVHYDSERPLEMYAKLLSVVNDAPTVDAEPVRHGKWIHNKWSEMRHDYDCSLCGCRITGVDPFSLSATAYYYCPECGAKMDEEDNDAKTD